MKIQNTKYVFPAIICVWILLITDTQRDQLLKTQFLDSEDLKVRKTQFCKVEPKKVFFLTIQHKNISPNNWNYRSVTHLRIAEDEEPEPVNIVTWSRTFILVPLTGGSGGGLWGGGGKCRMFSALLQVNKKIFINMWQKQQN